MRSIALIICLFLVGNSKAQQGFEVKGVVKNTPAKILVYLRNSSDGKTIATDTIRHGKFIFKGQLKDPEIFQIGFSGKSESVDLFLYNDRVAIDADYNDLPHASVTGSELVADYELFKLKFNPIKDQLNELAGQISPEKNKQKKDSLIFLFETVKIKLVEEVNDFTKKKWKSPVSSFVLLMVSPLLSDLETRYTALGNAAKRGSYARMIEQKIATAKINSIGIEAQEFSQKDTAGKLVSLKSFRGKYVLIDFWASWCGPCRAENPNVVAAYNQFKQKNFTVLGISLDDNKASWMSAIKKDQLFWTQLSDLKSWGNAVAQMYKVQSIPANLLIDPSGVIIAKNLRGEELIAKLRELIR
ncbi:MAG: AhpC/TSA family protein [Sphingobacteriia bacterium]|nr:MAG: AhpC/TSA family protein [Sphingobacteriia bacterium]